VPYTVPSMQREEEQAMGIAQGIEEKGRRGGMEVGSALSYRALLSSEAGADLERRRGRYTTLGSRSPKEEGEKMEKKRGLTTFLVPCERKGGSRIGNWAIGSCLSPLPE